MSEINTIKVSIQHNGKELYCPTMTYLSSQRNDPLIARAEEELIKILQSEVALAIEKILKKDCGESGDEE